MLQNILIFICILSIASINGDRQVQSCNRIVGGKVVSIKDRPYQVALFSERNGVKHFYCGGSIIGENWILTAGHCAKGYSSVFVGYGTDNICGADFKLVQVKHMIIHPKFDSYRLNHDIALMELKNPIKLDGETVKAIELAGPNDVSSKIGSKVSITGFGTQQSGGSLSCCLLTTEVEIFDLKICEKIYELSLSTQICAGAPNGGRDTCQGDSGGPLVNIKTQKQVGITSFGLGCGMANYPGVYTDVKKFKNWIKTITGI